MKKTLCLILIALVFLVYLTLFIFGAVNWNNDRLPEPADQQIVSVRDAELRKGTETTKITLPAHFDIEDEVWLRVTLDYHFSANTTPVLVLQANHTFMTFYLDGEVLYHVADRSHSLGNYFVHVPLPAQAQGRVLDICISIPDAGQKRITVPAMTISDEGVHMKREISKDIPSLLLNTTLLICGVMMCLLAFIQKKHFDFYKMFARGLLALNCAVYFMCETYSVVYMSPMPRLIYYFDLLSFSLIAPALVLLLSWELSEGWCKKLLGGIACLGMINTFVQFILSITGAAELRPMLPLTHFVQILGILSILCCMINSIIKKEKTPALYIGVLLAVCGAADMIIFLFELSENNVFFVKFALVIYMFYYMYLFIRRLMEQSAEKAREEYYKTLALTDPLSACNSRAAFELDKEQWDKKIQRTIYSLDLNNLKICNDIYGHAEGDRLIQIFGSILNQVFENSGKCYRVGGDEFWVFCDYCLEGETDEALEDIRAAAEAYNHTETLQVKISYAVGISCTCETKGDLNKAIQLADKRMYQNKHAIKSES